MHNTLNLKRALSIVLSLSIGLTPFFSLAKSAPVDKFYGGGLVPLSKKKGVVPYLKKKTLTTVLEENTSAVIQGNDVSSFDIKVDNASAFQSKLELIQNATKDIRLSYFIFSNDKTSSKLAQALIERARNGVKVKVLVDYHSNYKNLDIFDMMEKQAQVGQTKPGGSIDVRFYNRPTRNITLDTAYITTGCPKELRLKDEVKACQNFKMAKLKRAFQGEKADEVKGNYSNVNTGADLKVTEFGNSGLFLSGLYAKDSTLMATAIILGLVSLQEAITSLGGSSQPAATPEDIADTKKVVQLIIQGAIGNPLEALSASIQLRMILAVKGSSVRPIFNVFDGVFPKGVMNLAPYKKNNRVTSTYNGLSRNEVRKNDILFITDFSHHKSLIVDGGKHFQSGGRNVEDSYHVNDKSAVHKYLFMDTDSVINLKMTKTALKAGAKVVASFDRIFGFRNMVATISEIRKHAPNDYLIQYRGIELPQAENRCVSEALHAFDGSTTDELATTKEQYSEKMAKLFYRKYIETTTGVEHAVLGDQKWAAYKDDTEANGNLWKYYQSLPDSEKVYEKGRKDCLKDFNDSFYGRFASLSEQSISQIRAQRLASAYSSMNDKAAVYDNTLAQEQRLPGQDDLVARGADLKDATLYYLENLPFDNRQASWDSETGTATKAKTIFRSYGSKVDEEDTYQKRIHVAWIAGMQNTCLRAVRTNTFQEVVFHNAYFAPPSAIIKALGNMADGTWNCTNVHVHFITNSVETTDLGIVNSTGRRSMTEFFRYVRANKVSKSASFTYSEYKKAAVGGQSLHTKVAVFGDNDIVVGSANLDYRSLMMDTNNAVYVQNAPALVTKYKRFLYDHIVKTDKLQDVSFLESDQDLVNMDRKDFQDTLDQYSSSVNSTPEKYIDGARGLVIKTMDNVSTMVNSMLNGVFFIPSNRNEKGSQIDHRMRGI